MIRGRYWQEYYGSAVTFLMHHIRRHMMFLCLIPMMLTLNILWNWCLPLFSKSVLFFPSTRTLFLCPCSEGYHITVYHNFQKYKDLVGFYTGLNKFSLSLRLFEIWSTEKLRYRLYNTLIFSGTDVILLFLDIPINRRGWLLLIWMNYFITYRFMLFNRACILE